MKVQVHRGVFLSGPEVVDSNERRKALIKRFPEAVAIEMEGEGLYAAAHDMDIEWIVIKGISDYADGRKSETDSWRQFASLMAASLTAHILSDTIVFQDWPHYESAREFANLRPYEQGARTSPSTNLQDSVPHGEGAEKSTKRTPSEDAATVQTTCDVQLTDSVQEPPRKQAKISESHLVHTKQDGVVADDDLEGLSLELVTCWEAVARRLEFKDAEIFALDRENQEYSKKALRMLLTWKEKYGSKATYRVLHDALCHEFVNRKDLAEEFCTLDC